MTTNATNLDRRGDLDEASGEVLPPSPPLPSNILVQSSSLRQSSGQEWRYNELASSAQYFRKVRSAITSQDANGGITPSSSLSSERNSHACDNISRSDSADSFSSPRSSSEVVENSTLLSFSRPERSRNEIELRAIPHSDEGLCNSSSISAQEEIASDKLYDELEKTMVEADNSRQKAFEESIKCRKAENQAIEAIRRVKASESSYAEESKRKKEIEEALACGKEEIEKLKPKLDDVVKELQRALEQKSSLEFQIRNSDEMVQELEQKIFSAVHLLQRYKKERGDLLVERDNAVSLAEELRKKPVEDTSIARVTQFYTEFSLSEIKEATHSFDPSLKIGEGGYGSIYRGALHHTQVAVKVLHSNSSQGHLEFEQEMEETKAYLPEKMLVKILIHLPVKNLIQYRRVCKAWYRIIGSDMLVKSTISNTSSNRMYLLCEYNDYYTLRSKYEEEATSRRKRYNYKPKLFGLRKRCDEVTVFGCCNGLLCVADSELHPSSNIYLFNPMIRKAKRIPLDVCGPVEYADDLCFGYFHDDYKVIKIAPFGGDYCVGVYSLSTDSWKTIRSCHSDYATFDCVDSYSAKSKYVCGVAYFLKYKGRIACFDFRDETIREVELPEKVSFGGCSISVEAYGESLALVASSVYDDDVVMWVLRNRGGATNTFAWEMIFKLQAKDCDPVGFTIHGSYLMTANLGSRVYLTDPGMSMLEECRCNLDTRGLQSIHYLVGNLALINEKPLHPFVEKKPSSSTQNTLILYTGQAPPKKRKRKFYATDIEMHNPPTAPYYSNVFEF